MAEKEREHRQVRRPTPLGKEEKLILRDLKNKVEPIVIGEKTWGRP